MEMFMYFVIMFKLRYIEIFMNFVIIRNKIYENFYVLCDYYMWKFLLILFLEVGLMEIFLYFVMMVYKERFIEICFV